MPRRNKSLKMINFGGYKRRSSKRGGGFFDNLTANFKKTGDILKESSDNINRNLDKGTKLITSLPDKVANLEKRVSDLEKINNTVPGELVEGSKVGGKKRKTRRRRQNKKRSKKSHKSRKSRKSRKH